jgi:lysozyme
VQINQIISDLERDEGVRLKPYLDTVGKTTIGVGRNLTDNGITAAEARMLLQNDLSRISDELDRVVPWWREMSDSRQNALVNMAFNLGMPRLLTFKKMMLALENGNFETAWAEAMGSKWAAQVGKRANRIADCFMKG